MSCEHCKIDEDGCGAIFYDQYGAKAGIVVDGDYALYVESDGAWSCVRGVRNCPWCGGLLGGDGE